MRKKLTSAVAALGRQVTRARVTTGMELAGMGVAATGFGMMWRPLGFVAAGAGLVVVGMAEGRK